MAVSDDVVLGGRGPALIASTRGQIGLVIVLGVLLSFVWPGATRWPEGWVIPAEFWVTDFIIWLKGEAAIFGVPFKDITRAFGESMVT